MRRCLASMCAHVAEPCAAARVAGSLSPCPSTLCMIPAATDIYISVCTRPSAGIWPPEVVVRSESAPRARCACVPMRQTISHVRWQNSGVRESLTVILGVLSVSKGG